MGPFVYFLFMFPPKTAMIRLSRIFITPPQRLCFPSAAATGAVSKRNQKAHSLLLSDPDNQRIAVDLRRRHSGGDPNTRTYRSACCTCSVERGQTRVSRTMPPTASGLVSEGRLLAPGTTMAPIAPKGPKLPGQAGTVSGVPPGLWVPRRRAWPTPISC